MTVLHISLCGGFSVRLGDEPPIRFPTRKAEILFAYLVLNQRPFARAELAYLLWEDSDADQASTNLRKTLFDMRKVVGDWLIATRQTIAFDTNQPYWCDVEQILRQYATVEADLRQDDMLEPEQALVSETTADLYDGDLLYGLEVDIGEELEQWLTHEREHIRLIVKNSLWRLSLYHLRMGRYTAGLVRANRLIALDPYNEQAHRLLMRFYVRSGQITAALAQFERCREILEEELGTPPSAETISYYQRIQAAQERTKTPLPAYPNRFFGRDQDLARIDHWLDDPNCRLITIVGLGGSGKTRLAVQTAARRRDEFLHGITFVPLAAVDTADGMMRSILNSLKVITQGEQSIREQLINYLQNKELVLVLDNFEQLVEEAADTVQDLLMECPELKIVVTSRENLQIRAEQAYRLRGLGHEPVSESQRDHSLNFFEACVARQHPQFVWALEDKTAALQICQLVEGLPLGIELATAAMAYHSLPEIVTEIQQDFDFLITRRRDVPERHRSMRAMFAYSWRLLGKDAQACLQKLTVFRDGFSSVAARHVAQASRFLLSSLIDKSLIRLDANGRYSIHELLRQFAAETLADDTEVRHAHSQYFGEVLHQQFAALRGADQVKALNRLVDDLENIRAAWLWAAVNQNGELVSRAMDGLTELCQRRSLYQEGYALFAESANLSHKWSGDRAVHGRLCLRQALFLQLLAKNQAAREKYAEADLLLGTRANSDDQILLFMLEAENARAQGDFSSARRLLESGLALRPSDDGLCRPADVQLALIRVLLGQNSYRDAKEYLEQAYVYLENSADVGKLARAKIFWANLSQHTEIEDRTLFLLKETLPLLAELDDRSGSAHTHMALANTFANRNELESSLTHYQTAIDIYNELGMDLDATQAMSNLGTIYHLLADYDRAATLYTRALVLGRRLGDRTQTSYILSNLGELAYDREMWDEAEQYLQEGLLLSLDLDLPARAVYTLFWLGLLKADGYTASAPLAVSWFAANYEELPQFDRNFLLDTIADKPIEPEVLADAKEIASQLELETAVEMVR